MFLQYCGRLLIGKYFLFTANGGERDVSLFICRHVTVSLSLHYNSDTTTVLKTATLTVIKYYMTHRDVPSEYITDHVVAKRVSSPFTNDTISFPPSLDSP